MNTAKFASNTKLFIALAVMFATVSLGLFSNIAQAEDIELELTGAEGVPPVESDGSGSGEISVDEDGSISGSVTTSGIMGTAAHIHVGAKGENGPPAITLTKDGDTYSVPADTQLTAEQLDQFRDGNLYVNVHTTANPGGELRAQLVP